MVQWLRICLSNARDVSSILNQGIKIPHAAEQLGPHTTIRVLMLKLTLEVAKEINF